jgi:hypothetical protein
MTPENFIKAQLAEFAWREGSQYGGSNNMLAVAFVIRNRVRASWFGGDWLQVLENAHEAGALEMCFCENGCPRCRSNQLPNLRDDNFRLLLRTVDDIFSGLAVDRFTTDPQGNGALYYAELRTVNRAWFRENILRNLAAHSRIANVGPVEFFL